MACTDQPCWVSPTVGSQGKVRSQHGSFKKQDLKADPYSKMDLDEEPLGATKVHNDKLERGSGAQTR